MESSSPHSSELPVRGVAQSRYESSRSGSGGNSEGIGRLKHATRPHGNVVPTIYLSLTWASAVPADPYGG